MEICFFKRPNDSFDSALFAIDPTRYIPYDGIDLSKTGKKSFLLISNDNQEKTLIKKDLFRCLSPDAHFVVEAVDGELSELTTPKTGNITKRSIELFLSKRHWHKKRIKDVFIEIQGFILQISE